MDTKKDENFEFHDVTRQLFLKKVGMAGGLRNGGGIYHLYEATMMLKAKIGNQPLKDQWKDNFKAKMRGLMRCGQISSHLNMYFSILDEKTIKDIDVKSESFLRYRDLMGRVVFYMDILYEAYFILLDSTKNTKSYSVPNEYWADSPKTTSRWMDRGA